LTDGNVATDHGGPLSITSWAKTYGVIGQNDSCLNCTRLRQGIIADPALAATGIDWTGALATLNVGYRYYTWTRKVLKHSKGSMTFTYNKTIAQKGRGYVGGTGAYLDKGLDNLYFLSGKIEALSAGEYFVNSSSNTMYVWSPDGSMPVNVSAKTKDYCIQGNVNITNVAFHGCAFKAKGDYLRLSGLDLRYPAYHKTVDLRGPEASAVGPPAVATLEGDDGRLTNVSMRYSQSGGIKVG
jgi:hypothetical protein